MYTVTCRILQVKCFFTRKYKFKTCDQLGWLGFGLEYQHYIVVWLCYICTCINDYVIYVCV